MSVVLSGLGLGFVAVTARRHEAALRAAVDDSQLAFLIAAALLAVLAMVLIALPWRGAIRLAGGNRLGRAVVLTAFFRGEIAKYVPGGVWAVVGRGVWARRAGVPARAAALSVPLSLGALYIAAAVVAAVGWVATGAVSSSAGSLAIAAGALAVTAVAVLLVAPEVDRRLSRWTGGRDPALRELLRLVAAYVPAWAAVIGATFVAAAALGADPALARFSFAVPLAWLAGFLVAPAPAGLGVREAVFAVSCGLDPGVAAATAILVRGLFVGVDVIAFGAAVAAGRRR